MFLWATAALAISLSLALILRLIPRYSGPVVTLSIGAFQGSSYGGIDTFLGIPYAQPPVGDLRLRRPQPVNVLAGVQNATTFGNSCLQFAFKIPSAPGLDFSPLAGVLPKSTPSEDCLNLNVFRPSNTKNNAKLPVVLYFYGGAFQIGDASSYNASAMISRSVSLGTPFIFVSFNYRLHAFGFLGGQEVLDAGIANLALYDQMMVLEWIQKHISAFGGDPSKVTIWGESSGAASVTTHMILYAKATIPPFRGAIIQSTYTPLVDHVTGSKCQNYYNMIIEQTNCSSSASPLDCLRQVPAQAIVDIVNTTPPLFSIHSLNMSWGLAVDGVLLNKTLKQHVRDGDFAKVPLIAGQNHDEGTMFAFFNANLTSKELAYFFQAEYFPKASIEALNKLISYYPDDPTMGSPFDTGNKHALTSQFKRLSALSGDFGHHSGRREALSHYVSTQNIWSFLWKRGKNMLYLGSCHGAEIPEMFGTQPIDHVASDALINFINNLNPNYPQGSTAKSNLSSITWPAYNEAKQMLVFSDNATEAYTTITDDYREDAIQAFIEMQKEFGL